MNKKLLVTMVLGIGLSAAGTLLLVSIIRSHAVNIISTPPVPVHSQSVTPSPVVTTTATDQPISGMPVRVIIPSLNIDLPVIPGYYDPSTGQWTLTKTNVQFATLTTEPNNQEGNTYIYGHALNSLFGSLPKIQSGAEAIITTDNGHTFFYALSSTKVVDPSDSAAVLDYTGKPILTLQTCVGLLYQSRELLTFDFQRAV